MSEHVAVRACRSVNTWQCKTTSCIFWQSCCKWHYFGRTPV